MKIKHIISTKQFLDKKFLKELFSLATKLENKDKNNKLSQNLKNKIMACVFYEPSTRTRFSFESAMHKLGGAVISTENARQFSSAIKGESLEDTIRIISAYADIIVLRHSQIGSAQTAAKFSSVPIINAGDGAGEHPTQSFLDIYTIKKEMGGIENSQITLVGDLLYGRTIHSLIYLLALYQNVKLYLVSPAQLRLPQEYKEYLKRKKIMFKEFNDINKALENTDVIYMTRIQKERFSSSREYEKLKGSYVINKESLNRMKKKSIIMHPLPRVNEISTEVDKDKRAAYFRQARNGLYIRMALLEMIFNK